MLFEIMKDFPPLPKIKAEDVPDGEIEFGFLRSYEGIDSFYFRQSMMELYGNFYQLTDEQYSLIKSVADDAMSKWDSYTEFRTYIKENVVGIDYTDLSGKTYSIPKNTLGFAKSVLGCSFSDGQIYTPGSVNFDGMTNCYKFSVTFDDGETDTIIIDGTDFYIESNRISYACKYKITDSSVKLIIKDIENAKAGLAPSYTAKPVIYLYPEETQDISVKLDFNGELTYTYPTYNNGWDVTASPDGTIINKSDGSTHYYLFWEGNSYYKDWDFSKGFVVKGSESEDFLKEKLPAMGLTPREYNDFITYWVPLLAQNEYNLITFQTCHYEVIAPLEVSPAPDTVLRVHMVWKAIPEPVEIEEQVLTPAPERRGFTLVEWGGTFFTP